MAVTPLGPHDPSQIGPNRIIGVLGQGGMARVYLGRTPDNKLVAVKIVRRDADFKQEQLIKLFRREVRLAQRVNSPFVVALIASGQHEGLPWASFEYIEGDNLRSVFEQHNRLPISTVCAIGVALCHALRAIHGANVTHRDLSPNNVMRTTSRGIKVIDFGVATSPDISALTGNHNQVGTAPYVAPEIWQYQEPTPVTDIFALAAILVEAFSGHKAFPQPPTQIAAAIQGGEPDLSGVPHAFKSVIAQSLSKDPIQRPTLDQIETVLVRGCPALGVARIAQSEVELAEAVAGMTRHLQAGSTKRYPHPGPTRVMPAEDTPSPAQRNIDNVIVDPGLPDSPRPRRVSPAKPPSQAHERIRRPYSGPDPSPTTAGKSRIGSGTATKNKPVSPALVRKRTRMNRLIAILAVLIMAGGGIAYVKPDPGAVQNRIKSWFSQPQGSAEPKTGSGQSTKRPTAKPSLPRPSAPPAPPAALKPKFSVYRGAKETFEAYGSDARVISIKADGYSLVVELEVNYDPDGSLPDRDHPRSSFIEIDSDEYDRQFVSPYRSTFPTGKTGRMRGSLWFPLFLHGNYELVIGSGSIELGDNDAGSLRIIQGDINSKNGAVLRSYPSPAGLVVDLIVAGFDSDPNRACVILGNRDEVRPTSVKWSFKAELNGNYFWRGTLIFPTGTTGMINFDCKQFAVAPSV